MLQVAFPPLKATAGSINSNLWQDRVLILGGAFENCCNIYLGKMLMRKYRKRFGYKGIHSCQFFSGAQHHVLPSTTGLQLPENYL